MQPQERRNVALRCTFESLSFPLSLSLSLPPFPSPLKEDYIQRAGKRDEGGGGAYKLGHFPFQFRTVKNGSRRGRESMGEETRDTFLMPSVWQRPLERRKGGGRHLLYCRRHRG